MIDSIDTARPLQQGDFVRSRENIPWGRLGVTVTADCDIAKSKHWGRVSIVPVETASVLCSTLLARAWLEKQRGALIDVVRADYSGSKDLISQEHAELLISSRVEFATAASACVANALTALDTQEEPINLLSSIVACNEHLPKPSNLLKWFDDKLQGLPGDLMAIPIPSLDGQNFGVAWLRTLREIQPQNVVSTSADWGNQQWIRIGRLGPEYRYRLTQKLASVFSDIGLPGKDEKDCKEALSQEISTLLGAKA